MEMRSKLHKISNHSSTLHNSPQQLSNTIFKIIPLKFKHSHITNNNWRSNIYFITFIQKKEPFTTSKLDLLLIQSLPPPVELQSQVINLVYKSQDLWINSGVFLIKLQFWIWFQAITGGLIGGWRHVSQSVNTTTTITRCNMKQYIPTPKQYLTLHLKMKIPNIPFKESRRDY